MEKYYVPSLLINEGQRVKEMFPKVAKVIKPGGMDDSLKQLIYILVKLKPAHVSRFGKERSEADISSLAGYVVTNTLNVNCTNIYALLEEYASPKDWEIMFGNWQNYSERQEPMGFLKRGVLTNPRFQAYLADKDIGQENLSWIDHREKVQILCNYCKGAESLDTYKESLKKFGLIEDTLLMNECLSKFFLNCTVKAYQNAGEINICGAFNKLSSEDKLSMIINFVKVFTLQELKKYMGVCQTFESEANNKKFADKLKSKLRTNLLADKYDKWINALKIVEAFADDEDPYRREYWLRFSDQSVNEITRFGDLTNQVLIMDFGRYVITEFGEKAAGKAYLFTKEYFDKNYKWYISFHAKNEYIHKVNKDINAFEKLKHFPPYGGWWDIFDDALRKYGIVYNKV